MKLYDISIELKEGMINYPKNPKFKIKRLGHISEITLGTHTGTHIDAKKHISNKGSGVDKIPIEKFSGKSKVLDLTSVRFGEGISEKDLKKFKINKGDIILLKTRNSGTGFKRFKKDFIYLTGQAAKYLVKKKIKSFGIDYLSIQKFHTLKDKCTAHCILLNKNIPVFEGLDLRKIKQGEYIFVGLPLKIKDADGSPARAILIRH